MKPQGYDPLNPPRVKIAFHEGLGYVVNRPFVGGEFVDAQAFDNLKKLYTDLTNPVQVAQGVGTTTQSVSA